MAEQRKHRGSSWRSYWQGYAAIKPLRMSVASTRSLRLSATNGNGATSGDGAAQVVEFALGDPIRVQLEEEARRQRVPLNDLLIHAALIYLADLDIAPA